MEDVSPTLPDDAWIYIYMYMYVWMDVRVGILPDDGWVTVGVG